MNSRQLGVHLMVWSGRVNADETALFPLIYPFDMGSIGGPAAEALANPHLSDEEKEQICGKTAATLFGLTKPSIEDPRLRE